MRFSIILIGVSASVWAAPAELVERALPSGHPIIDQPLLESYSLADTFTAKVDIFPSGFNIPTETLTAVPSGYSIGPTAVWGPDGKTVSAFPESALAGVALVSSAAASSSGSLSLTSQSTKPASTGTAPSSHNGAAQNYPSVSIVAGVLAVAFLS